MSSKSIIGCLASVGSSEYQRLLPTAKAGASAAHIRR